MNRKLAGNVVAALMLVYMAAGCSSEADRASSEQLVASGPAAQKLGIASYGVNVLAGSTALRLLGPGGEQVGELLADDLGTSKRIHLERAGRVTDFEFAEDRLTVLLNGQHELTIDIDQAALAAGEPLEQIARVNGDASQVSDELELLKTITEEGGVKSHVERLRAPLRASSQVAYMMGMTQCPPWVWITATVNWETGAGTAVLIYCTLAWL